MDQLDSWTIPDLHGLSAALRSRAATVDEPRKAELLRFMAGKFSAEAERREQRGPMGLYLSILV